MDRIQTAHSVSMDNLTTHFEEKLRQSSQAYQTIETELLSVKVFVQLPLVLTYCDEIAFYHNYNSLPTYRSWSSLPLRRLDSRTCGRKRLHHCKMS